MLCALSGNHRSWGRLALAAVAMVAAGGVVAGCGDDDSGGSGSAATGSTKKDATIAVIVPQPGNSFYAPLQAGAEAAGKELGVKVLYQGPPNGDPVQQNAMISAAVQRGVDGIVLASSSADAAVQAVNQAVDAKIPVVTTSADTPRSKRNYYYGEDGPAGGRINAQALAAQLEKQGKTGKITLAIGSCLPGAQIQQERIRAFKEELKKHVDFDVVSEFNSTLDEVKNKQAWQTTLSANPNVDAVLGGCAIDTRSAGLAVKAAGNKDTIAFGYDLLPDTLKLIEEGWLKWAMGESPYKQGHDPVKALVDNVTDGKPLPKGFVPVQLQLVTPDKTLSKVTDEYDDAIVTLETDVPAVLKRESAFYK